MKSAARSTPGDVRARRAQEKRTAILRAGLRVFAEKGFGAATMDDVALELEATKGLLYYYFKTKEELLEAILENNALTSGVEAVFAEIGDRPLREGLDLLAHRLVELMESNRELVRFIHVHALLSRTEAEIVYATTLQRVYGGLAGVLRRYQRCRAIRRDVDCDELARSIATLLISSVLQAQVFGPSGEGGPGYLQRVLDVLARGIETTAPARTNRRTRPKGGTQQGGRP